jgi:enamine deaminase RidA (YjgF/YER057c/UK114 family)
MTIQRIHVGKRLSQIVRHGDTVFLAGQVPDDGSLDATAQTRQVLDKVDSLLAETGTDKHHILSATIYLSSMDHFAAMNTAWEAWMPPGAAPARATVQALLANPTYLVEIQIVAALRSSPSMADTH